MINDTFLNEVTKAINNESFTYPDYLGTGNLAITALSSDTSLTGETGDRLSTVKIRDLNTINYNVLKTGAGITEPTGEYLYSMALFSQVTAGNMFTEVSLPGIIQTTSFDVEVDWYITVNRE